MSARAEPIAKSTLRRATEQDLTTLHALINRAYRGPEARSGWTHESDFLEGERTDVDELAAILTGAGETILILECAERIVGCVRLTLHDAGWASIGLLAVDPRLQTGGAGKRLLTEAESEATRLGVAWIELTVVDRRTELIAYYERRGYALTGERRPFPYPTPPDVALELVVLEKVNVERRGQSGIG